MDFKSPKGWNAAVGPLSVLDDHSRYLVVLQAVWSAHAELVREQLETAFARCGVPDAMLMDHGIPWLAHLYVLRLLRNSKSSALDRKMLRFALCSTTTYDKTAEFRNSLFL
jgi:transposase InsO family protein